MFIFSTYQKKCHLFRNIFLVLQDQKIFFSSFCQNFHNFFVHFATTDFSMHCCFIDPMDCIYNIFFIIAAFLKTQTKHYRIEHHDFSCHLIYPVISIFIRIFIFFCKNIQKVVFVLCRISKNTDTNLFFLHIMCYNNLVGNKSRIWLARLKG